MPTFEGFSRPNFTPVPDELFDDLLSDLSGAELKVLLYIVRRTFGFKKDADTISLNQMLTGITTLDGRQLDRGTGLSRSTLVAALKSLVEQNIIIAETRTSPEKGNEPTIYQLNFKDPLVRKSNQGESENRTSLVRLSNPQETVVQETVKQETDEDPSNIRKASSLHKQEYDESRLTLVEYIADLSTEFIDTASIASSTTRAVNLFRRSGLSMDEFIDIMTEARAVTKERMASIKKRNREGDKTKMAYFFSILEDRLGLRTA
jgi:phage replication O-like protein O